MAPHWPDEVDVFSVPHSRMKKLVSKYSSMISTTDFRDEYHLTTLLANLVNVFKEFKAHEHIENILIMRQLRNKLRAASVTSAAVCNCHSDNRLTDMLDLVTDGYRWTQKTVHERQLYGQKLRHALEDFTENFIPHMEEEEEVFQPMLMQYFSYEELKDLKAKVIQQHDMSKRREEYHHEKFVEDFYDSDESCETARVEEEECHFSKVPSEICVKIFSFLNPKDLTRLSQVSQRFHSLSRDPLLWSRLHPLHWAQGNWTFQPEMSGGVDGSGPALSEMKEMDEQDLYVCVDEDADVDESGDSDESENIDSENLKLILKEAKMITSMVKYLLPHVGSGVKVCDLAYSRGISSSLVHKILKLCPNLESLDLTHTRVGDAAFKEFGVSGRQSKLRHLDLTGCENVTDLTLFSLAPSGGNFAMPSYDGFDEDKDIQELEIENVPPSCSHKVPVCCGRSLSEGAKINNKPKEASKFDCCGSSQSTVTETTGDLTQTQEQQTSGVEEILQCENSQTPANSEKSISSIVPSSDAMSEDMRRQSTLGQRGDPQSCDLSFVYLDMLIESDENVSCGQVRPEIHSLQRQLANFSLTEDLDYFEPTCDIAACSTNSVIEAPNSCLSQRTSGCEIRDLNSFTETLCSQDSVENDALPVSVSESDPKDCVSHNNSDTETEGQAKASNLEFLSLNGCYQISDHGLSALAEGQGTPHLLHLDLSGCVGVTGYGLSQLVSTAGQLDHSNLYYCDNVSDDPYPTTASGCRNLQCDARFCCSFRE